MENLPYVETKCWNAWITYCSMKNIIFPSSNLFWNLMKAEEHWAYCFSRIRLKECNCEHLEFFLCTVIDLSAGHFVSWVYVSCDQGMRTILFGKQLIIPYVFTFLSFLSFSEVYSTFQALNTSLKMCVS